MEKELLSAALQSRTSYALIQEHVNPQAKNKKDARYTPEFRILMQRIGEYYDRDKETSSVNMEIMAELIDATTQNDKHKERFKAQLQEALAAEASVPNINALILMAKRHEVGAKLAVKLVNKEEAAAELEEYNKLVAQEALAAEEEDKSLTPDTFLAVLESIAEDNSGIRLRPKALAEAIGRGLLPGSKVTITGRPEGAKSAFCITQAAGLAMEGKRTLYLINEDPAENIYLRVIECLTGKTEAEVLANPQEVLDLARRRGLDNVVVKDIHPGSVAEVDAIVKKEKPDVVIVDQLRNLKSKADSRVNQLDEVARELRDVAKANGVVVIDVTQAGESAEGKSVLSMTDIADSKTGLPAAADVLIGIGFNKEQEAAGYRVLTLCKNKVNGNHASITVKINPAISRYTDV